MLPDPDASRRSATAISRKSTGDPPQPVGWHYQRQLEVVADDDAPSGKNYVTFRNTRAGPRRQALQGFAVDGRKVSQLELSFYVRGQKLRPGSSPQQSAMVGIIFYDENRTPLGEQVLGPWRDSFPWQPDAKRIEVPARAKEGIVRMGLFGAVGELSIDDIRLRVMKKGEARP